MARFLVVGGAGFIGSHMMKTLVKAGHDALAFDNLSPGHADAMNWLRVIRALIKHQEIRFPVDRKICKKLKPVDLSNFIFNKKFLIKSGRIP